MITAEKTLEAQSAKIKELEAINKQLSAKER